MDTWEQLACSGSSVLEQCTNFTGDVSLPDPFLGFTVEADCLSYGASLFLTTGSWVLIWPWAVMCPLGLIIFFIPTMLICLQHLVASILPARASRLIARPNKWPRRLPDGVWTIHGRRYDLSQWAERHPGGSWALELGRNRDCTGLFESYHTFANQAHLQATLKRFELQSEGSSADVDRSNSTGLVFGCTFHEDVRKMALQHFAGGKSHKMKVWTACTMTALVCIQFVLMYYFLCGSRLVVPILPVVSWLVMANVAHDASHFSVCGKPMLNRLLSLTSQPFFFGSTVWHFQHVVQHHVYTNDEADVDISQWLPVVRTSRLSKFLSIHKWQWLTVFFAMPTVTAHLLFVVPLDLLSGARDMISGKQRYSECENHEDLVAGAKSAIVGEVFACYMWMGCNVYSHGWWEAFWRCMLAYSISSYIFVFFTEPAHLQHGLDDDVVKGDSWAKRQVSTAMNFSADSPFWSFVSGGLNMQALHHVLPSVGSSHLIDMWPKYQEVCTRHGVQLHEVSGFRVFVNGFYNWVHELSFDEHRE